MILLDSETYEFILRIIVYTLIDYDVLEYPINPFELSDKLGLKTHPYSKLSEEEENILINFSKDGFSTEKSNGEWHIFYRDKNMNQFRIRYTLMHEIGHFVLAHINIGGEKEEAETNFFSRNIIAPNVLIYNTLSFNVSPQTIGEQFLLSKQASEIAYKNYLNWLYRFKKKGYKDYEIMLLNNIKIKKLVA